MEEALRLFWFGATMYLFVSLIVYALHSSNDNHKYADFKDHWKEILGEFAVRSAFILGIYISGEQFLKTF